MPPYFPAAAGRKMCARMGPLGVGISTNSVSLITIARARRRTHICKGGRCGRRRLFLRLSLSRLRLEFVALLVHQMDVEYTRRFQIESARLVADALGLVDHVPGHPAVGAGSDLDSVLRLPHLHFH